MNEAGASQPKKETEEQAGEEFANDLWLTAMAEQHAEQAGDGDDDAHRDGGTHDQVFEVY